MQFIFLSINSNAASSVDLFVLKPFCWFANKLCDIKYFISCVCMTFLNSLDIDGNTEIGRLFLITDCSFFLNIGTTFATFNWSGNMPVVIDWLIISLRHSHISFAIRFSVIALRLS